MLLLLVCVSALSSCEDKGEITITNKFAEDVPGNVQLLGYTSKSITVAWDFNENATSYTVQLLTSPDSDNPAYTYTTATEDYFEFGNLNARTSYYARVRANFPYSETSKWVYIMNDNSRARIIPAYGVVDDDFEITYIKLVNASSSTVTAEWSFTDFLDMDSEINNQFTLELYKDAACTDLYISWENISGLFTVSTVSLPRPLRFTFSGLDANTEYYLKIKDETNKMESNVFKVKTLAAIAAPGGNPSKADDILLSQDFSKFIHGGDILYSAAGYTVSTALGRGTWAPATGANPVKADLGQNVCNLTTEFNVFDGGSVAVPYTVGTGMENWGKNGNTSTRPGYIKIGGSGAVAALYTPKLSQIGSFTSVTVSIKAAVYSEGANNYCDNIKIEAIEGAAFSAKGAISNLSSITVKDSKTVNIAGSLHKFDEYSVTLNNITPETRIAISSDPAGVSGNKTRFLLDDVIVKIK